MAPEDRPESDPLRRHRQEYAEQASQAQRQKLLKVIVWVLMAIVFLLGCCGCPVWTWIGDAWKYVLSADVSVLGSRTISQASPHFVQG